MAYGITSESQLIDITTISRGCTAIEAAAEKFEECAKKITRASEICNAEALSVDKTTMQPQLEADAAYIKSIKTAVDDFTRSIRSIALQVHSEQSAELNSYKAQQASATTGNNSNTAQTTI